MEERQLLAQSRFVFAQRVDPTTDRRHMLAKIQIQALDKGGMDLPTALGQDGFDGRCRAKDDAVFDPDDTPAPVTLGGLEQGAVPEGPFPHSPRLEPYMIVSKSYGSTPVVTKFPLQVTDIHETSPMLAFS
jgi:hypothetical protein